MTSPASARRTHRGARPGGRSEVVRAAIITATAAELQAVGYGDLTMASVAKRAEVALTTVHRRWDSKAALVADAVVELTAEIIPTPDFGSLEQDLRHFAQTIARSLSDPGIRVLLRSMLALPEDDLARIREQYWPSRYAVAREVMQRAIARGEIPDQPQAARVVELLSSTLWVRVLVTNTPVDDASLDRLVTDMLVLARNSAERR